MAAAFLFAPRAGADELPKEALLPLSMATKAVQTALEACKKDGYRVSVSVVDRAGVLRAMLRATVSPSSTVAFADFNQGPLRSGGGVFQLEEPLRIDVDLPNKRWSGSTGRWVWQSPRLQTGAAHITMQRASLRVERTEGSAKTYQAELSASLDGVVLEQSAARSAPFDLSVQVAADPQVLKADIQTRGHEGESDRGV